MNRKLVLPLFIGAAAAATGSVFADEITLETTPVVLTKSRAEVQSELAQHRKAGIDPWSIDFNQLTQFMSTRTRDQVAGEFKGVRAEVANLGGEDSGAAYLARTVYGVDLRTMGARRADPASK